MFDTDCVLCSGMVRFVLAHERDHAIQFAGAWSPEGLDLAARHGLTRADLNETFLFVTDGRALTRSDAALALLGHMRAPWRWLRAVQVLPRSVRDALYTYVARRRYRWFGQRTDCTVVPRAQRGRFIGVRSSS